MPKKIEKSKNEKVGKARKPTTPLSRLRRSAGQLARIQRVLEGRFRAWRASPDPQVALGFEAAADLGRISERFASVVSALEAASFVPPEAVQYKPVVEGEHVRVAPKYRFKYSEKCADQLRACPTLFDDLVVSRVFATSRTVIVGRVPYASFEARRSHLLPVRRG